MSQRETLRAFVVYEPSYWRGFLATASSLSRNASRPLTFDILVNPEFACDLKRRLVPLQRRYKQYISFHVVQMPGHAVNLCKTFSFRHHFLPEILYRLYYFDIVRPDCDFVVYCDIDTIWRGDVYDLTSICDPHALVNVVEDVLPECSKPLMPIGVTSYLNSGLLLFRVRDLDQIQAALRAVREILPELADRSAYLDQDAINIIMHQSLGFLPRKWNWMTKYAHEGVASALMLHASGSKKPWQFLREHPYRTYYLLEMKLLGFLPCQYYDFTWPFVKAIKKFRSVFPQLKVHFWNGA